jgi:hypothetical protein
MSRKGAGRAVEHFAQLMASLAAAGNRWGFSANRLFNDLAGMDVDELKREMWKP